MTFFLLASFPSVGIPHLTKDWEISGVLLFPNAYTSKRVIVSMCEQAIGVRGMLKKSESWTLSAADLFNGWIP